MVIDFSFSNIFTIAFIGMLLYQFILSLFRYTLNKQKEYLFYNAFLFVLIINFTGNFYFWLIPLKTPNEHVLARLLLGYPINFLIQIIYLIFLREYLHTKELNKLLHEQINILIKVNLIIEIITLAYCFINTKFLYSAEILFNAIDFILFCIPLYLVIKSKILYYKFIVVGTICLGIGLVANLILSINKWLEFDYDITIMIGMLIEIIIFNYAMQLKIENQGKALLIAEIEKQKAIEKEQNRVSADLHDEVGSTLSSIQIMSVVSLKKIETDLPETKNLLKIIVVQSQKVQHSLSDIVWGLRTDLNSVEDFGLKIREILSHTLEPSQIECNIFIDKHISNLTLSVLEKRNILLIFKETINNILKYANANNVSVSIKKDFNYLSMFIKDNGKGFDYTINKTYGNGLKNMEYRALQINATIKIESVIEKGTSIFLKLPIQKLH